uniref:SS18 N-terminal domain-containing protein n=1 Tax=Sus scrofa TaxID=9823 RepID=A0A8D1FSU9_PIG
MSTRPKRKGEVRQQTIQKMLDENHDLIQSILDYQSKSKTAKCIQNHSPNCKPGLWCLPISCRKYSPPPNAD